MLRRFRSAAANPQAADERIAQDDRPLGWDRSAAPQRQQHSAHPPQIAQIGNNASSHSLILLELQTYVSAEQFNRARQQFERYTRTTRSLRFRT